MQEQERLGQHIDKTEFLGVVEEGEDIVRFREVQATLMKTYELQAINDEVLDVHGNCLRKKQDGVIWMMYENANGIWEI